MKTRYSSGFGDVVERNFACKVTLDKPERLLDCVHTSFRTSTNPTMGVILSADLIEIALFVNFNEIRRVFLLLTASAHDVREEGGGRLTVARVVGGHRVARSTP